MKDEKQDPLHLDKGNRGSKQESKPADDQGQYEEALSPAEDGLGTASLNHLGKKTNRENRWDDAPDGNQRDAEGRRTGEEKKDPAEDGEQGEQPATPVWKIALITVLSVFLLIGLVLLGGYIYLQYNLSPPAASKQEVAVTIPKGATSGEIGKILFDKGLIRNPDVFRFYLRYKGLGSDLKAGEYRFTPGMSIDALLSKMEKGEVYRETFTVTIPEGLTVPQVADLLSKKGVADRETFLKEVNEGIFTAPFLQSIPSEQLKKRKYRLEGYLFPDTYTFTKGATEHEMIARLLDQFGKVFQEEWQQELAKKGLNIDQAVILASLIEREAVLDEERPIISGVFYNRLEERWKLQSCATVQYVLGKQKERITFKDLEIEDPYNTYLHAGLPPGPIANPGKKSLEAAVFPAKHSYFFFVTKEDGSKGHYFSKTFAEHQKHANSEGSW